MNEDVFNYIVRTAETEWKPLGIEHSSANGHRVYPSVPGAEEVVIL